MTAHNKQKRKKDPYKIFVRLTIIIAAVALAGLAVFLVCNAWVDSEYNAIVDDIYDQNIADEQAFNMELDAQRENASQTDVTDTDVAQELQSWETTLEETVWKIEDEGSAGLENPYTEPSATPPCARAG